MYAETRGHIQCMMMMTMTTAMMMVVVMVMTTKIRIDDAERPPMHTS